MDTLEITKEKCLTRKEHSDSNMSRHKMPKQPKKYEVSWKSYNFTKSQNRVDIKNCQIAERNDFEHQRKIGNYEVAKKKHERQKKYGSSHPLKDDKTGNARNTEGNTFSNVPKI